MFVQSTPSYIAAEFDVTPARVIVFTPDPARRAIFCPVCERETILKSRPLECSDCGCPESFLFPHSC